MTKHPNSPQKTSKPKPKQLGLWGRFNRTLGWTFKKRSAFWLIFVTLTAFHLIWWVAFFPGVMSPDSLDEWRQALTHNFSSAHPISYSLLMSAFRRIKDTPAWVTLIQIIASAGVIATGLSYAYKKGAIKRALVIMTVFFGLWPVFGLYNITMWKDILYATAILATGLTCFKIVVESGKSKSWLPYIGLGLATGSAAILRHDGTIYLVIPFVLTAIFARIKTKKIAWSFFTGLIIYLTINFGVAGLIKAQPAPLLTEWIRLKAVGALYNQANPDLSADQRSIFESIMPAESWKVSYACANSGFVIKEYSKLHPYPHLDAAYQPLDYNYTFFQDANMETAWKKAVISGATRNPLAIIKDRICLARRLLGIDGGGNSLSTKIDKRHTIYGQTPHISQTKRFGGLKQVLTTTLDWSRDDRIRRLLFWSALPYLVLSLVYLGLAIKNRLTATVTYCLISLASPVVICLIAIAASFRYVYPLLLTAPFLPILFAIEKRAVKSNRISKSH